MTSGEANFLARSPALWAAAVMLVIIVGLAYWNWRTFQTSSEATQQTDLAIRQIASVLSTLKDAETGQRGFLLTGAERYLEPYNVSVRASTALTGRRPT